MVKTSPSNAGGAGLIPGQGVKILHDSQPKNQNMRQKQYCNKLNKSLKNGSHQKKKKSLTIKSNLGTNWCLSNPDCMHIFY